MKTFYFDTGVKPYAHNPPVKLGKRQILRGTIQIPFDCEDVPEGARFLHGSDDPNPSHANEIVREIHNSTLVSKYAHFFYKKND